MADLSGLLQRIRDEFAASEQKLKDFQARQIEAHHARQEREAKLEQIFVQLQETIRPRLEALAKEFGDRLQVAPLIKPGRRQATMQVKSPLATIKLQLSACANSDVTKLVLAYDLDILPILMEFERHSEIEFPIDAVEPEALAAWLDDRIVGFVRTYLSLHENEYYLKDQMVNDPIANVRFPKFAAAAQRQRGRETVYFISEETATEFDKQK